MNIAIIDDGINIDQFLKHGKEVMYFYINEDSQVISIKKDAAANENSSHGTICAEILYSYAESFKLTIIKISMDKDSLGNIDDLICALSWCESNNIDLINLSIGTSTFSDFLKIEKSVKSLTKSGIIIVAANNNNGQITYPAYLPNVIGVKYDVNNMLDIGSFCYFEQPLDGIEIVAHPDHPASSCNSFATPYITSVVNNLMNNGYLTIDKIRDQLRKKAVENRYLQSSEYLGFTVSENPDIPIICILDDVDYGSAIADEIVNDFRQLGYNGIALALTGTTLLSKGLINYNNAKIYFYDIYHLILFFQKITDADVVVFCESCGNNLVIQSLFDEKKIDAIIRNSSIDYYDSQNNNCHIPRKSEEKISKIIMSLFSS